jgi:hypothetical protein
MRSHLCQILAHYVVYLGSKLNLPIASHVEKFILKAAPQMWHKQGLFWWNTVPVQELRRDNDSKLDENDPNADRSLIHLGAGYVRKQCNCGYKCNCLSCPEHPHNDSTSIWRQPQTSSLNPYFDASMDWPATLNQLPVDALSTNTMDPSMMDCAVPNDGHTFVGDFNLSTELDFPGSQPTDATDSSIELPFLPRLSPCGTGTAEFPHKNASSRSMLTAQPEIPSKACQPAQSSPQISLAELFRTTPKTYICNQTPCEDSFSNISDFTDHLEFGYSPERHACIYPFCANSFLDPIYLAHRLRLHTRGEEWRDECNQIPIELFIAHPGFQDEVENARKLWSRALV